MSGGSVSENISIVNLSCQLLSSADDDRSSHKEMFFLLYITVENTRQAVR